MTSSTKRNLKIKTTKLSAVPVRDEWNELLRLVRMKLASGVTVVRLAPLHASKPQAAPLAA